MTKKEKENYKLVKECIFWAWDNDDYEIFEYFCGQEGEELIRPLVNCSDLFYWACSDAEEVTKDNFHLLEESKKELLEANEEGDDFVDTQTLAILFACKSRQMRPQTAYYRFIEKKYWHLFDACGDIRTDQPDREEYLEFKNKQRNSIYMMWYWFINATKVYFSVIKNLRRYRI